MELSHIREIMNQARNSLPEGHWGSITSLDWHPDGDRLATGSRDGTVRIWSVREDELQCTDVLSLGSGAIEQVAYGPNGQLAIVEETGTIQVRHANKISEIDIDSWSIEVAWHPDGHLLAAGAGRLQKIWPEKDELTVQPKQSCRHVHANASAIVALEAGHPHGIFKIVDGEVQSLRGSGYNYSAIRIGDDGRIIVAGDDGYLRIFDAESGKETVFPGRSDRLYHLAYHDGVAAIDAPGGVETITIRGAKAYAACPSGSASAIAMSSQGWIAAGDEGGSLAVWKEFPGNPIVAPGRTGAPAIAATADGSIAAFSDDDQLTIWGAAELKPAGRFAVKSVGWRSFAVDEDAVVTLRFVEGRQPGEHDHPLHVFEKTDRKGNQTGRQETRAAYENLRISSGGIALGSSRYGAFATWTRDGKLKQHQATDGQIWTATWINGDQILLGDSEGTIFHYTAGGRLVRKWHAQDEGVMDLAPLGPSNVVSTGQGGSVRIWTLDGNLVRETNVPLEGGLLAATKGGHIAVAGNHQRAVAFFSPELRILRTLRFNARVNDLSRVGKDRFAVALEDGTIRIVSASGVETHVLVPRWGGPAIEIKNFPIPGTVIDLSDAADSGKSMTPRKLVKALNFEGFGRSGRPIRTKDDDLLDYGDYAEAISSLVRHEETEESFILAISGPWGQGKSSLASLIENDLSNGDFQISTFDSWMHDSEGAIEAAFTSQVARDIFRAQNWVYRAFQPIPWTMAGSSLGARLKAWGPFLSVSLGIGVLIFLATFGLSFVSPAIGGVLGGLGALFSGAVMGITAPYDIIKRFGKSIKRVERTAGIVELREQVKKNARRAKKTPVIFVDNLERCEPPRAVNLLETVEALVMEAPLYVILLADVDALSDQVSMKYGAMARVHSSSNIPEERMRIVQFGRRYVEKFVHCQFDLPPLVEKLPHRVGGMQRQKAEPSADVSTTESDRSRNSHHVSEQVDEPQDSSDATNETTRKPQSGRRKRMEDHERKPVETIETISENADAVADVFAELGDIMVRSPRGIIRFLNRFRLIYSIAEKRRVVDHARLHILVGAYCLLIEVWPAIGEKLREHPALFGALVNADRTHRESILDKLGVAWEANGRFHALLDLPICIQLRDEFARLVALRRNVDTAFATDMPLEFNESLREGTKP